MTYKSIGGHNFFIPLKPIFGKINNRRLMIYLVKKRLRIAFLSGRTSESVSRR